MLFSARQAGAADRRGLQRTPVRLTPHALLRQLQPQRLPAKAVKGDAANGWPAGLQGARSDAVFMGSVHSIALGTVCVACSARYQPQCKPKRQAPCLQGTAECTACTAAAGPLPGLLTQHPVQHPARATHRAAAKGQAGTHVCQQAVARTPTRLQAHLRCGSKPRADSKVGRPQELRWGRRRQPLMIQASSRRWLSAEGSQAAAARVRPSGARQAVPHGWLYRMAGGYRRQGTGVAHCVKGVELEFRLPLRAVEAHNLRPARRRHPPQHCSQGGSGTQRRDASPPPRVWRKSKDASLPHGRQRWAPSPLAEYSDESVLSRTWIMPLSASSAVMALRMQAMAKQQMRLRYLRQELASATHRELPGFVTHNSQQARELAQERDGNHKYASCEQLLGWEQLPWQPQKLPKRKRGEVARQAGSAQAARTAKSSGHPSASGQRRSGAGWAGANPATTAPSATVNTPKGEA
jgi:hypothetical protein